MMYLGINKQELVIYCIWIHKYCTSFMWFTDLGTSQEITFWKYFDKTPWQLQVFHGLSKFWAPDNPFERKQTNKHLSLVFIRTFGAIWCSYSWCAGCVHQLLNQQTKWINAKLEMEWLSAIQSREVFHLLR